MGCDAAGSVRLDVTDDMIHIRYQSTTGDAHGHGPLEAGRTRLVAAAVLTRFASNMASAGGIPNAVLKHPDELTAEQSANLQAQWVQSRMSSMGLPAVLSGGLEFETLQYSPKDMALVELAQLNESRIAVLLGVPPFLMGLPSGGDSMTYSNVVVVVRLSLAGRAEADRRSSDGRPVRPARAPRDDGRGEPGRLRAARPVRAGTDLADPRHARRRHRRTGRRRSSGSSSPANLATRRSAAMSDVEVRSVSTVEVRFAERMIDIIAVPYDQPTKVTYHGRMIDEVVTRGAFEGVQMRKFPVNRAHDLERPIGWANKLRPRDERGLVAEIGPLRPHP